MILPHTKRKRKLTKVAASIIYSSFESEFPEETGRMVQWLTARVRTIKNDRELFKKKKKTSEKLGFLEFEPGRILFLFLYFRRFIWVPIMSYFVFTNSKVRSG